MTDLTVVIDGQYGSCGKGHATGWLARKAHRAGAQVIAVRVGGPNAGHTTVIPDDHPFDGHRGKKVSLQQIPVAGVVDRSALLIIGAGSEIDLDILGDEINRLVGLGIRVKGRLIVDKAAVVIEDRHRLAESAGGLTVNSGNSTNKGVGAARAERAMRKANRIDDEKYAHLVRALDLTVVDTGRWLNLLAQDKTKHVHIMVEGIQGHGLSVYSDAYPKVTSGGTDAVDMLAMARINPWAGWGSVQTVVVMRTRPIRIAGNSGPLANERTWEELGLEPEITTVTKRVRRVGEWDPDLAWSAGTFNGGPNTLIWLSMVDQMFPETAGSEDWRMFSGDAAAFVEQVERDTGCQVGWLGTSDRTVVEL